MALTKVTNNQISNPIYINIKDNPYNAKGDGITNDASIIQSAIDALSVNGGTIKFTNGTYLLNVGIILPNNVHLIGSGKDTTIIKYTGTGTGASGTYRLKVQVR